MSCRLQDKKVLITAGAAGLGRAMAERFSQEGAKVAICDVNAETLDEVRVAHPDWLVERADVASESDVDRLFQRVGESFGGLDILVNNAGIAGPTAPIEEIAPEDWQRTQEVSVFGMFLCVRRAVPLLRAAGVGAIINLSSSAGKFGFPYRTPYSAAKWAVIGVTKSLAIELGPDQIRVNAILPGLVSGARLDQVISARATQFGRSFDEQRVDMLARVAMRTSVEAGDVANLALFLASSEAARITGEALSVDAGLIALA